MYARDADRWRLAGPTIAVAGLAMLAAIVTLAGAGAAHTSDEHGQLTFHDTEDGPPSEDLSCQFWIEGHRMSHANVTIQVVHDRREDRHVHTAVEAQGAENANGTFDVRIGPLERHSHVEAGEQWFTAKMGDGHSTNVSRVTYTVCEGFVWPLPGEDPHGCQAPETVTARVEGGAVVVEWAEEPFADEHELAHVVERAPAGTRDFQAVARPTPNATDYRDTDVEVGQAYHYFVTQILEGSRDQGYPCDHATVTVHDRRRPTCPRDLQAQATQDGPIRLSWNAPTEADSYHVHRTPTDGDREAVAELEATTYVDTTTEAGTTYRYEVTAKNPAGEAQRCPVVEATAIPFLPDAGLAFGVAVASVGALALVRRPGM